MPKKPQYTALAPETFADVIEGVLAMDDLTKSRRRDLVSALRSLAKFFDLRPDEVPANTNWLRHRLRQFHPAQVGVSEKYLANLKSAVLAALKLTGSDNTHSSWQPKMTPEFQVLYDAIPDTMEGYNLSRFFRWCSDQGLTPGLLTDTTVEAFEDAVVQATLVKDPSKVARKTVLTWNKMKGRVAGWPDITLYRAPARVPWTFPLEAFPQAFQIEVNAWCDRLGMSDLFDDDAPIRANRRATIKHRRFQIRMMASAIVRQGVPMQEITSLADLVDLENFRRGVQFMIDRHDGKVTEAIFILATGIKSIARYHVKVDDNHLDRLKRLCSRLDQQADRYRKKNKDRLAQFDDPRNMARLLNLPARLLEKAKATGLKPRSASLLAQSAIAIETLLFCPMRISNLASLNIDRHLRWVKDGREQRLLIEVPGDQVKNAKPLYYELSGPSAEMMRFYIDEVRPGLSDAPGTALFPKLDGTAKNPGELSHQIKQHILAGTGLTVHVHLFRSLASKIHNLVHPGDAATISHVLGDRMETVMRAYSQFDQKSALDTYQSSLNTVRGRGKKAV